VLAVTAGLAMQASRADADTVDRTRYAARLADARSALVAARAAPPASRQAPVDRARSLLLETTAVRLADGSTVAVDDGALAARLRTADAALDAAIADLALLADLASRRDVIDPGAADARLRQLVGEHRARGGQVSLIDVLSRAIARFLSGLGGAPPDTRIVVVGAGGIGLALLLVVLGIVGRDLRERFRRDVVLPELVAERAADPAEHLRTAEEALRAARARDAIRALYLYAIGTLAARELVRYDPSLTDRELLARARAIPHADALRDLVDLHERASYGLREVRADDALRARALALRAVAS
jgi:hypothetical protein